MSVWHTQQELMTTILDNGSDAWTQYDHRTGQAQPSRADHWHCTPPEEVIDGDDVSGIRTQMWMRAMKRSLMTHRLS